MSMPAQGEPSVPKKKGFDRMLNRVKTALRRANLSRRISKSVQPRSSTTAPPTARVVISEPVAVDVKKLKYPGATRVLRSQVFEERAKKLGEIYGLEFHPGEWYSAEKHVLRVEKTIKMRVHCRCHKCNSSFGSNNGCPKCKHHRCRQCPRMPPKWTEEEKEESRKRRAAISKYHAENAPIIPDWNHPKKEPIIRMAARKGGQELIFRKPRQRVRRTCCLCENLFPAHAKACSRCQHDRCTDCPRDPQVLSAQWRGSCHANHAYRAKKDIFPYGYPGDRPGVKSGHYKCRECNTIFQVTPAEHRPCPKCSCRNCERVKPRKVEPEPDPEVWAMIQAKLAELNTT